jgi:hypothetical protein
MFCFSSLFSFLFSTSTFIPLVACYYTWLCYEPASVGGYIVPSDGSTRGCEDESKYNNKL